MRPCYVYIVFDFDGIPRYVGMGSGRRADNHNTNSGHPDLLKIRETNGWKRLPVVIIRDGLTARQAAEIEAAFIRALGRQTNGGPLVNRNEGGNGVHDEEARAKLRALRLGKRGERFSATTRANMRAAHTGLKHSDEHRAAIGAALKGRAFTPEWRAKLSAAQKRRKGIPATQARKEAIRIATLAYWARRRALGDMSRPRPRRV